MALERVFAQAATTIQRVLASLVLGVALWSAARSVAGGAPRRFGLPPALEAAGPAPDESWSRRSSAPRWRRRSRSCPGLPDGAPRPGADYAGFAAKTSKLSQAKAARPQRLRETWRRLLAPDLLLEERRARRAYDSASPARATQATPLLGLVAAALLLGSCGRSTSSSRSRSAVGVGYSGGHATPSERSFWHRRGSIRGLAQLANGPVPGCVHGAALSLCTAAWPSAASLAALRCRIFARGMRGRPGRLRSAMAPPSSRRVRVQLHRFHWVSALAAALLLPRSPGAAVDAAPA
jgi:hypothetical protein